jgi:hypothetical protein
MKTELKQIKIEGRKVWQWRILAGRKILAGGMCATKADAKNDSAIWLRDAHAMQPNIRS